MKEIIHHYAAYDLWANTRMVERLQREDDTVLDRHVKSSFPSLRLTVLHLRDAGNAWYHRVSGRPIIPFAEGQNGMDPLLKQSVAMNDMVRGMEEERLLERVSYTNLKGDPFTQPRWQMLMHCFNHASYHRGQLVTIMRQLDLGEVPNTDLIGYQRLLLAKS